MLPDFSHRLDKMELMDDLSRPDEEFDQAYHELEVTNRRLGGIRAVERFLPKASNLLMLDVAAGGCDVSEALLGRAVARIVALDINPRGFRYARKSWPVVGDALELPFREKTFDVVMASLFFHHLSNEACVRVLANMWRVSKRLVLVNDLYRHPLAYFSIRALSAEGVGILIPTSDYEEVVQVADRAAVIARGRIVARFEGDEITTEALAEAAGG